MTTGRINQVTRQIHRGGGSTARAQPNTGTKSGRKLKFQSSGLGPTVSQQTPLVRQLKTVTRRRDTRSGKGDHRDTTLSLLGA